MVVTTGVLEFIGKITQHIEPKGFRTVEDMEFIQELRTKYHKK